MVVVGRQGTTPLTRALRGTPDKEHLDVAILLVQQKVTAIPTG